MRPLTMGICGLLIAVGPGAGCAKPTDEADRLGWQSGESEALRDAKPAAPAQILPMTHYASGRMLERQGSLPGAIEQYEKAIAANPRFGTAYNRLGGVYMRMHRAGDAERAFRNGIDAVPDAAYLRNNLGDCYRKQGRLGEAEAEFREAIALRSDFVRAHNNLAIVLVQIGRADEAFAEFCHGLPPDRAKCNVGVVLLGLRDHEGAGRFFRQALDLNPECAGAVEGLQRVNLLAGDVGDRADGDEP